MLNPISLLISQAGYTPPFRLVAYMECLGSRVQKLLFINPFKKDCRQSNIHGFFTIPARHFGNATPDKSAGFFHSAFVYAFLPSNCKSADTTRMQVHDRSLLQAALSGLLIIIAKIDTGLAGLFLDNH